MFNFKKATITLATTVAVLGATFAAQADEWRGWNIHVEGYPNTIAMDEFATLLEEKTDGRISLKMYHGGTLGSQPDAIEQVRIGGLEIGNFSLGPIGPIANEANLVSLPFVFKDVGHMFRAMNGAAGAKVNEGLAKKGLIALAYHDAGARSFYNTQKPIMEPADVTGMKIRVMNNDLYSGMISALGGNPSPMAFAEVYQALKTNVVDGAENNWPSYESTGHYEVAGFYSLSQHLIIPECVCINADVYSSLSDADQKAVKDAAMESAETQHALWKKRAKASEEKAVASGVKVNVIEDKAAFQAAMQPVYDVYLAANPEMKELVELVKATD